MLWGLYKELRVCVSWGVWICDSHIFRVWMSGDNRLRACLKEHCKIIFEEIFILLALTLTSV